jgi:uncharacterized protein (TIGR02284 family)
MADVKERIDTVMSLHTALVDSRNGYEEALEDAKGKGLSGLFRDMIELRLKDAEELAQLLLAGGQAPDRDGSFMSSVHRTVIKIRSLFTDLDASILPGLIDGEERILGYYGEAIAAAAGTREEHVLDLQRKRLRHKVDEMRRLLAASA